MGANSDPLERNILGKIRNKKHEKNIANDYDGQPGHVCRYRIGHGTG